MDTKKATPPLAAVWESTLDGHVIDAAWSPNGAQLAVAVIDGPVSLWSADGNKLHDWPGHKGGTMSVSWSRDGSRLATAGHDGRVRVLDPLSGAELHSLEAGASWAVKVSYCPTADVLASAAGKKLRFWSHDGRLLGQAADHASTLTDLAWRPKSATPELASAAYGGLSFWAPPSVEAPAATGEAAAPTAPQSPLRHFPLKVSLLCVAWAPNGFAVASGNQDSSVHFWFAKTGQDLQMSGYAGKVRELAWDSTSRFLATGGSPTVTVWDCGGKGPANTQPLLFEDHDSSITALAYQRAKPLLAAGCEAGGVSIWSGGRPKWPSARAVLGSPITRLVWSPSDAQLAVASESGRVCVFRSPL